MKEFIRQRLNESLVFEFIETMMDEDYPSSFDMSHFELLTNFKDRVNYCEQHLKRISSGSARIVYMVDDTKVLKLAKNQKGVAQCETEIKWGNERYYSDILAKTLDFNDMDLWVEMELARKVKASDFRRLLGLDFNQFGYYLRNFYHRNRGNSRDLFAIDPKELEILRESEFVNMVAGFMQDTDSPAGDLARLNSYGLVNREGTESIVIIDFGLTGDVYSTYYDKSR